MDFSAASFSLFQGRPQGPLADNYLKPYKTMIIQKRLNGLNRLGRGDYRATDAAQESAEIRADYIVGWSINQRDRAVEEFISQTGLSESDFNNMSPKASRVNEQLGCALVHLNLVHQWHDIYFEAARTNLEPPTDYHDWMDRFCHFRDHLEIVGFSIKNPSDEYVETDGLHFLTDQKQAAEDHFVRTLYRAYADPEAYEESPRQDLDSELAKDMKALNFTDKLPLSRPDRATSWCPVSQRYLQDTVIVPGLEFVHETRRLDTPYQKLFEPAALSPFFGVGLVLGKEIASAFNKGYIVIVPDVAKQTMDAYEDWEKAEVKEFKIRVLQRCPAEMKEPLQDADDDTTCLTDLDGRRLVWRGTDSCPILPPKAPLLFLHYLQSIVRLAFNDNEDWHHLKRNFTDLVWYTTGNYLSLEKINGIVQYLGYYYQSWELLDLLRYDLSGEIADTRGNPLALQYAIENIVLSNCRAYGESEPHLTTEAVKDKSKEIVWQRTPFKISIDQVDMTEEELQEHQDLHRSDTSSTGAGFTYLRDNLDTPSHNREGADQEDSNSDLSDASSSAGESTLSQFDFQLLANELRQVAAARRARAAEEAQRQISWTWYRHVTIHMEENVASRYAPEPEVEETVPGSDMADLVGLEDRRPRYRGRTPTARRERPRPTVDETFVSPRFAGYRFDLLR